MFPAFSVLSYRTALLQNCGDLPLTFCLDHSSNPALAESLSVVPGCGLIHPGHHQILTLRTTPTEDGPKQGFSLHLQLNAAKHTKVRQRQRNNSEISHHMALAGFSIHAFVCASFRSWQLSVWWRSQVFLWKETAACISIQQRWARGRNAPTTSGTSAAYLYSWFA